MSMPPPSSCWDSLMSALSSSGRPERPPATMLSLQEQLIAASEHAGLERLRERAGALQRELDGVAGETEAAEAAARAAERRAAEAEGEVRAAERERESLREVEEEIEAMDRRIKLLEAIVATITPNPN
uniref:Uncharacterized protein n=1 Tax=Leersia perrieri TaxID=77586 RepID=A0A0D9UYE1_9ORYZ